MLSSSTSSKSSHSLSKEYWMSENTEKWGRYHLPYFPSLQRKLSNSEAMQAIQSTCIRSQRVPQGCKRNAIFLIAKTSLKDVDDAKSDMNSVPYRKCHEVKKTVKVEVTSSDGEFRVIRPREINEGKDTLCMHVNRRENKFGLLRNIIFFSDNSTDVINNTIVLQYYINRGTWGNWMNFLS